MNINVTLFAQMVVFAALIWFSMKFVWPMVLGSMQERERRIADGLAAAQRGTEAESEAQAHADVKLQEARERSAELVAQAERQATEVVEQAKANAISEGDRLIAAARAQIEQETTRAREELRVEVANLALAGAQQILSREVDAATHEQLLNDLVGQL